MHEIAGDERRLHGRDDKRDDGVEHAEVYIRDGERHGRERKERGEDEYV